MSSSCHLLICDILNEFRRVVHDIENEDIQNFAPFELVVPDTVYEK